MESTWGEHWHLTWSDVVAAAAVGGGVETAARPRFVVLTDYDEKGLPDLVRHRGQDKRVGHAEI